MLTVQPPCPAASLWVDRSLNSSPESSLLRTLLKCFVNCGALNSLQMQSVMLTYDRPAGDEQSR